MWQKLKTLFSRRDQHRNKVSFPSRRRWQRRLTPERPLEGAYTNCEKEMREVLYKGRRGRKEKAREKAHRRLTRIYGFVGLANKESARETGFPKRHSHLTRHGWNRLLPSGARKHWIRATFRISWPASTRAANLWPRSASRELRIR